MAMILNEQQSQLKETANRFLTSEAPVRLLRKLRDENTALGFDELIWSKMVEFGWPAILVSEEYGGLGLDLGYLAPILEECGRTLVASPLFSTGLMGATALMLAGSDAQKADNLPDLAAGKLLTALAIEESPRHKPNLVALTAERQGNNFKLNGKKQFVLDGHISNYLIVSARTAGSSDSESGISLFLVDSQSTGLRVHRTAMVDSRNSAWVEFEDVVLSEQCLLGQENHGARTLNLLLDISRIGLAAEMLGNCLEVFERTLAYLREREQFGVYIGSFQALKHRAAHMFCEIELCKSVVADAVAEVSKSALYSQELNEIEDNTLLKIAVKASVAQSQLCDTLELVSNEGIQMHGGIGMTDEHEIGFYLKRARVAQQIFGDALYHKDRYACLKGF